MQTPYWVKKKNCYLRLKFTAAFALVIREFMQQRQQQRQRERQKSNKSSKTTTLHVDHAFLYIALPSLHDYDGKMPNFAFYGDVNNRQPNFLSLSKLECDPQEINSREICLH